MTPEAYEKLPDIEKLYDFYWRRALASKISAESRKRMPGDKRKRFEIEAAIYTEVSQKIEQYIKREAQP